MGRKRIHTKTEMAGLLDKTGMTLEQASKRLGVSVALVRHVAAGRRNMSDSMREKIRQVFALGGGKKDVEMAGYATKQDRDEVADILGQQVRALIHAAGSKPDKGAAVVAEISAALDGILARHKLDEKVSEFCDSQSVETVEKATRRVLDDYFLSRNIPFPPSWEKVHNRVPPDDLLTVKTVRAPEWFAPRSIQKFGLVTKARMTRGAVTVSLQGRKLCAWTDRNINVSVVKRL
jgi:transcriptional regulator with XRE-family HTH domain